MFTCISVGLSVFFLLYASLIMTAASVAIVALDVFAILVINHDFIQDGSRGSNSNLPAAAVIVVGLAVAAIFRQNFAWPSMPGWDVYAHLSDSNWIVAHHGISNLFPVAPGSPLPYPYLFSSLVAAFSLATGVTPYTVFWLGPYFSIPLYALLVFGLATTLTGKRTQALFAAIIAATISGGDAFLGPQYFFPSTAFALLFMLGCLVMLSSTFRGRWHTALWISILALAFLMYYSAFFLSLPILVVLYLRRTSKPMASRRWGVFFGFTLLFALAATTLGSGFLGPNTVSLSQRVTMLQSTYSDFLWLLLIFGGLMILNLYYSGRTRSPVMPSLLLYIVAMVLFIVAPIPSSYRAEVVLRPIFAIVASFAILFVPNLPKKLGAQSRALSTSKGDGIGREKVLVVSFLLVSSIFLVQPYWNYAQQAPNWSNVSSDEYNAAAWLRGNTPAGGYILTDPSTGFVLRGLTLLNCSTSFIVDGQARSPDSNGTLTSLIFKFFSEQDLAEIPSLLSELPTFPAYIVITTRTVAWIANGNPNSTFPAPTAGVLSSFTGLPKFSTPLFSVVASWNTVEVLRLTGVQFETAWSIPSFSGNWKSWYLDGAYGNYSATILNKSLDVNVTAKSSMDAWTGPIFILSNLTGQMQLETSYSIDKPVYAFEVLIWYSNSSLAIYQLQQSVGTHQTEIAVSGTQTNPLTRLAVVLWTKDDQSHALRIYSLSFLGFVGG